MSRLSIILPTNGRTSCPFLLQIIQSMNGLNEIQLICVNYGEDSWMEKELSQIPSALFIPCREISRGGRMNIGLKHADAPLILLHHPRSYLSRDAFEYLLNHNQSWKWGAFTHCFDLAHPVYRFISWYSNFVRGDWKKIYYLDHCLFADRKLLESIGGIPEEEIFEDTILCQRLKRLVSPIRLPFVSTTSSIRFKKNGLFKQSLLNIVMKLGFYFGCSSSKLNHLYEWGIGLNGPSRRH